MPNRKTKTGYNENVFMQTHTRKSEDCGRLFNVLNTERQSQIWNCLSCREVPLSNGTETVRITAMTSERAGIPRYILRKGCI